MFASNWRTTSFVGNAGITPLSVTVMRHIDWRKLFGDVSHPAT